MKSLKWFVLGAMLVMVSTMTMGCDETEDLGDNIQDTTQDAVN